MAKLVYPRLSYKIVGLLFEVHSRLGGHYQEKYYQRAVEQLFKREGIHYQKEIPVDINFEGNKLGKYFLDFLIEGKIILELKAVPHLDPIHFRQVRSYLKTKNLQLGILANFRGDKLISRRVLNPNHSD